MYRLVLSVSDDYRDSIDPRIQPYHFTEPARSLMVAVERDQLPADLKEIDAVMLLGSCPWCYGKFDDHYAMEFATLSLEGNEVIVFTFFGHKCARPDSVPRTCTIFDVNRGCIVICPTKYPHLGDPDHDVIVTYPPPISGAIPGEP